MIENTDEDQIERLNSRIIELLRERDEIELLQQRLEFAEFEWNRATMALKATLAALQEAIEVFEGMCDDEIEVDLLPRLRAVVGCLKDD